MALSLRAIRLMTASRRLPKALIGALATALAVAPVSSGRPVIELILADLQRPCGDTVAHRDVALLWQHVSKVLTHDDWYSEEDILRVRAAVASSSNLTPMQRQAAWKLGPQRREKDDYYSSNESD